jgi:hypothetical protein
MKAKYTVYMFLMDEYPYYFEQDWHFGNGDACDYAVRIFAENEDDEGRKLIARLTFDELCGLKEVVDEIFENLLRRYNANQDDVRNLLLYYPWLKEKADINPLFDLEEREEEGSDG